MINDRFRVRMAEMRVWIERECEGDRREKTSISKNCIHNLGTSCCAFSQSIYDLLKKIWLSEATSLPRSRRDMSNAFSFRNLLMPVSTFAWEW